MKSPEFLLFIPVILTNTFYLVSEEGNRVDGLGIINLTIVVISNRKK